MKFLRAIAGTVIFGSTSFVWLPSAQAQTVNLGVDYGDAPDSGSGTGAGNYKTLLSDGGPSHTIVSGLLLGSTIDPDSGTLQNANATADDENITDDEDGVSSFPVLENDDTTYSVPVNVTNTTGSSAYLVGYLDVNKDGDFLDTGEKSATVTVPSGGTTTQTVTFTGLTGLTSGDTYIRFRLSNTQGQAETSVGASTSGEVEDYRIPITRPAPICATSADTFSWAGRTWTPTDVGTVTYTNPNFDVRVTVTNNGAILTNNGNLPAGSRKALYIDQSTGANDLFDGGRLAGEPNFRLNVSGTAGTYLTTTLEFLKDGSPVSVDQLSFSMFDFDRAAGWQDRAVISGSNGATTVTPTLKGNTTLHTIVGNDVKGNALTPNGTPGLDQAGSGQGSVDIQFSAPIDKITIDFYNGPDVANNGPHAIGLISAVSLCSPVTGLDYGDAPDSYGTDKTAGNSGSGDLVGASHGLLAGLRLGTNAPDLETDGQPTVDADGDNVNDTDDEDGVNFAAPTQKKLTVNTTSFTVNATATNTSGSDAYLVGWIDFDKNGKFDPTEKAVSAAIASSATLDRTIPLTWSGITMATTPGDTYARFRLTTDPTFLGLAGADALPTGAATNGEVEDYKLAIEKPNVIFVKRITDVLDPTNLSRVTEAVTPSTLFDTFNDDTTSPAPFNTEDNDAKWPDSNTYLAGVSSALVRPGQSSSGVTAELGDIVEYTVYFLSNGTIAPSDVKFCDWIPPNTALYSGGYNGANNDVALGYNPDSLEALPNPALDLDTESSPTAITFYNESAVFIPAANVASTLDVTEQASCGTQPVGSDGLIFIDPIVTSLPIATASGTPTTSYGFVKFRVQIK